MDTAFVISIKAIYEPGNMLSAILDPEIVGVHESIEEAQKCIKESDPNALNHEWTIKSETDDTIVRWGYRGNVEWHVQQVAYRPRQIILADSEATHDDP